MRDFILRVTAERCLDGVEVVRCDTKPGLLKSRYGSSGAVWFSYRSNRCQRESRDVSGLEDTLVIRFINATDDNKRIAFLSRFGLPSHFGIRDVSEGRPTQPQLSPPPWYSTTSRVFAISIASTAVQP